MTRHQDDYGYTTGECILGHKKLRIEYWVSRSGGLWHSLMAITPVDLHTRFISDTRSKWVAPIRSTPFLFGLERNFPAHELGSTWQHQIR